MISCSLSSGTFPPKADEERRRIHHSCLKGGCLSSQAVWSEVSRLLEDFAPSPFQPPNGWCTAVLHWQALCSCPHTKAASWRTALVSPAPDDLRWRVRRGSQLGLHCYIPMLIKFHQQMFKHVFLMYTCFNCLFSSNKHFLRLVGTVWTIPALTHTKMRTIEVCKMSHSSLHTFRVKVYPLMTNWEERSD